MKTSIISIIVKMLKPKKMPNTPPKLDIKSTISILGVSLISVYSWLGKNILNVKWELIYSSQVEFSDSLLNDSFCIKLKFSLVGYINEDDLNSYWTKSHSNGHSLKHFSVKWGIWNDRIWNVVKHAFNFVSFVTRVNWRIC